ncbi:hypothetical protein D3C80_659870 [compost metagenome]
MAEAKVWQVERHQMRDLVRAGVVRHLVVVLEDGLLIEAHLVDASVAIVVCPASEATTNVQGDHDLLGIEGATEFGHRFTELGSTCSVEIIKNLLGHFVCSSL